MQLSYYCKTCSHKNFITTNTTNRYDLQKELNSEYITKNCDQCGSYEKRHINRLDAVVPKYKLIIAAIVAILLTGTIFIFGWIATFTITAPIYYYYSEEEKAIKYNKIKIPRS